MIDDLMMAAERMATEVSRRRFLGKLGRAAMLAAAAVGGLAAKVGNAKPPTVSCEANSSAVCVGKSVGDSCYLGRLGRGKCVAAPACYCQG